MARKISLKLPELVVHADWGSQPSKRWMASARLAADGTYDAFAATAVGETDTLISRLLAMCSPGGTVFLGFDFPIGIPISYAQQCEIENFLQLLPVLGLGKWQHFYQPAQEPEEISLTRPFYPQRPGHARQAHLLDVLGVHSMDNLRRVCELSHPGRRAAAPLFWTLGGQQVGKAAISGWRDVLAPARKQQASKITFWPFSGTLDELLSSSEVVIAETYPAEFYKHLKVMFPVSKDRLPISPTSPGTGKRSQAARIVNANALLTWAARSNVHLSHPLRSSILNGFGPSPNAEDPFDSTIGLFGMLNVLLGQHPVGELPTTAPITQRLRKIEGWILGQEIPESFPSWVEPPQNIV